jgi:hypothetical protein
VVGVLCTAAVAALTGLSWVTGVNFAVLSCWGMWGHAPGTGVPLIDQLPEFLLPLALLAVPLGLSLTGAVIVVLVFALLNMISGLFRQRLRISRSLLQLW